MRQTLLSHDATQTSLLFSERCMMGKQPDVVSGNHKNAASHLQWELVCQEGAHQVAGVTSQPQQQEPDGDGSVHVARLAGTVVLPAHRKQTDRLSCGRRPDGTRAACLKDKLTAVTTP